MLPNTPAANATANTEKDHNRWYGENAVENAIKIIITLHSLYI
jgi:hypothetical protein